MSIYKQEFTVPRPSSVGPGEWRLSALTDVAVLFGRNGVGKSQLLRAVRDQDGASCHYASPERGGEISHDPSTMQREFDPESRRQTRQANYQPSYRVEAVSRIATYLQKRGNVRADVIPMNPSELEALLSELIPSFRFEIPQDNSAQYRLTRLMSEELISSIGQLSSGEAEMFTLGVDLLTICAIWELEGKESRLLLIDSPDTHLHPELQQQLAKFLVKVMKRFSVQMLIATHSTTLLAALGFYGSSQTSVIYLSPADDEQRARPFTDELAVLATCLGGHALMGPLFAYPLLLVEGDDDYKLWCEAARRQVLKFAVIPCDGSRILEYRRTLERLLRALRSDNSDQGPAGFMLRDRDEAVGDPTTTSADQIISLRLACRESENLYLTDEVLAKVGVDWNTASARILEQAAKYGNKQTALKAVATADRKTHDVKGIANELVSILDPKHVDWRTRVGQVIGAERPAGQLADFLGMAILETFWAETAAGAASPV